MYTVPDPPSPTSSSTTVPVLPVLSVTSGLHLRASHPVQGPNPFLTPSYIGFHHPPFHTFSCSLPALMFSLPSYFLFVVPFGHSPYCMFPLHGPRVAFQLCPTFLYGLHFCFPFSCVLLLFLPFPFHFLPFSSLPLSISFHISSFPHSHHATPCPEPAAQLTESLTPAPLHHHLCDIPSHSWSCP